MDGSVEPVNSEDLPSARLAAKVRELRAAQHLTQAQIAKRAGYTRTYVTLVESGTIVPGREVVVRLDGWRRLGARLGVGDRGCRRSIRGRRTSAAFGRGRRPAAPGRGSTKGRSQQSNRASNSGLAGRLSGLLGYMAVNSGRFALADLYWKPSTAPAMDSAMPGAVHSPSDLPLTVRRERSDGWAIGLAWTGLSAPLSKG